MSRLADNLFYCGLTTFMLAVFFLSYISDRGDTQLKQCDTAGYTTIKATVVECHRVEKQP